MNRRGVPDGDMPDRSQPADWGSPPLGDRELDDLARSVWGVDEVLTALRAGPGHAELTGETRALAEFRRVYRRPRHRRRRRTVPATLIAAAAALVAVAVCGAVAEAGRLPTPIQNLAHAVFAAPTPLHARTAHGSAHSDVDPRASWSHACKGYQQEVAADRKPWQEPGYSALVSAAHGSGHVSSYCDNGDFPRGTSYPGHLSDAGTDQRPGWRDGGQRAGDSSPGPAGSDGTAGPGRGPGSGPSASPSAGPSTSAGATPGATPGDTPGQGGGASSGGTSGSGWGSDPAPGPSSHYPGSGG